MFSPFTNEPVTPSNEALEALPFVLENPVAPDVIPTYFLPDTQDTLPVIPSVVNRSTSAMFILYLVAVVSLAPLSNENPNTLACPIAEPLADPPLAIFLLYKSTVSYNCTPPYTLLILTKLPKSDDIDCESAAANVLGLTTSLNVLASFSVLYPETYAVPGEICTARCSSTGVLPSCVV